MFERFSYEKSTAITETRFYHDYTESRSDNPRIRKLADPRLTALDPGVIRMNARGIVQRRLDYESRSLIGLIQLYSAAAGYAGPAKARVSALRNNN